MPAQYGVRISPNRFGDNPFYLAQNLFPIAQSVAPVLWAVDENNDLAIISRLRLEFIPLTFLPILLG